MGEVTCCCKLKDWRRAMRGLLLDGKNGMSLSKIIEGVILDVNSENSSIKELVKDNVVCRKVYR